MQAQDQEILAEFEPIAAKISAQMEKEFDGSPHTALVQARELEHQLIHWLEAHRNQLSDEGRAQLDAMERPEAHLMFPPRPELGLSD